MSLAPPPALPSPTIREVSPGLPREIRRLLARVDRRLRRVALTKGLGTLFLVVAVGAAVGMSVELAFRPAGSFRWIAWGVWVAVSALALGRCVLRPLGGRNAPLALAALAERGAPRLGECLVNSVALIEQFDTLHGSPTLALALTRDAAEQASTVDPRLAVDGSRAGRRLLAGVFAVGLVGLPALVWPDPFRILLTRFAAPWLDLDPVGRFVFRVAPGDKSIAVGSDLKVSARLNHRLGFGGALPDSAALEWTDPTSKQSRRLPMASLPVGSTNARLFEVSVPRLMDSITYRVVADFERSRPYEIKAVAPPTILAWTVSVEPPAYTKSPTTDLKVPTRLEVIEGSKLTFAVTSSKPVRSIALKWPSGTDSQVEIEAAQVTDRRGRTVSATADTVGSFAYAITLKDDDAGLSAPPETRRLVVRPDAPPSLVIREVEGPKEAGPLDVLGVGLTARDDFGVASVELHYRVDRKDRSEGQSPEEGKVEARPSGLGTTRARGDATLSLKPLNLKAGDSLSYRIRVADNRPAPKGPNVVWSDDQPLSIVEKAEPLLARRDRMRREGIKDRLDKLKAAATENRREAEQLRYAADAAKRESKAWDKEHEQALTAREEAAAKVRDDLKDLARDLASEPGFRPMARPVSQVANVEAEASRERLELASKAPDAAARLEQLRQADARLGSVQTRIDELTRQFDTLAKVDADRQILRELAAREEELADKLATAKAEDLDRLQAEQDAARKDLDAVLARSPELRAGVLAKQADEAAELAEKAKALAERQREQARQISDLARPNDKLKELAAEQRKIEDDARRLALEVDEPLAENGRGRLNVEPLRNAVDPIERGDVNQGRQKIDEAERELRRLARDLADVIDDPKALARRLARRQEVLAQRVAETIREAKGGQNLSKSERETLAKRLKPLGESQKAIAKLAGAIKPSDPNLEGVVRDAARLADAAAAPLTDVRPGDAESKQNEAKGALNRLADALPDAWKRQEPARQKLDIARRLTEEAQRDLERHLRETAPRPGQAGNDPIKLAADLAERLKPMSGKLAEAKKALGEMKPDAVAEPQRRRAERRTQALADAVENLRKQAIAAGPPQASKAVANWQVAGPFPLDAPPPFDPGKPVDFAAPLKVKGKDGKPVTWKKVADGGRMNLGQVLKEGNEQSAFAVAEINSPTSRIAKLDIGSDDTLTVWLNGKKIHEFNGNRSFAPDATSLNVELKPGLNRLVVKVGNKSDRWEFGAAMTPPSPGDFRPERLEALREAMPSAVADSRAALDRLTRKMAGQTPADDLAEEIASEQQGMSTKSPADPLARAEAVGEQKRAATALRNLEAPDAALLQSEAVRQAERAAEALTDPKVDPAPALKDAAAAAKTLADHLTDRLSPRSEAVALAKAQRALDSPEAARSPTHQVERQKAIADRAALLSTLSPNNLAPLDATRTAARATERAAQRVPAPAEGEANALPEAPQAREAAAKALEELAGTVPDAPPLPERPAPARAVPNDPELTLNRERVAQADGLARRQRQVRERLQAIVGDRVKPQNALRDEAAHLGQEFADLRDETQATAPQGHGQAAQAADLLGKQAPQVMDQGASQLVEGKPRDAKETQRRAAEMLERGAQMAEDLAATLKSERDAHQGKESTAPAALGDARAAMSATSREIGEARQGRSQAPSRNQAAALAKAQAQAPAARKAADALRTAAQGGSAAAAPPDGQMAEGEPGGNDPKSRPIGTGTADLTALQAAIQKQTGRAWGELPGHLRTEILQRAQGRYRDDYARLIQLYFQEIAADGGREEP